MFLEPAREERPTGGLRRAGTTGSVGCHRLDARLLHRTRSAGTTNAAGRTGPPEALVGLSPVAAADRPLAPRRDPPEGSGGPMGPAVLVGIGPTQSSSTERMQRAQQALQVRPARRRPSSVSLPWLPRTDRSRRGVTRS